MKKLEFDVFDAVILKHDKIDSAHIEFPYDVHKEFGRDGRIKVKVLFDGFLYRGSLVKMGSSCHVIGITKEVRKIINKNPGILCM